MPSTRSARRIFPGLSPGGTDRGADYHFYNPFTTIFIDESEALIVLRGMARRLPTGHPKGWDFREIDDEFVGYNADLVQSHDSLNGWSDEEGSKHEAGLELDEVEVMVTEPVSAPTPVVSQY